MNVFIALGTTIKVAGSKSNRRGHGVSERELMELGGWKVGAMVRRYAHLAPNQLAKAAGTIDRVMAQSRHSEDRTETVNT